MEFARMFLVFTGEESYPTCTELVQADDSVTVCVNSLERCQCHTLTQAITVEEQNELISVDGTVTVRINDVEACLHYLGETLGECRLKRLRFHIFDEEVLSKYHIDVAFRVQRPDLFQNEISLYHPQLFLSLALPPRDFTRLNL
jgi:hypothetical protein